MPHYSVKVKCDGVIEHWRMDAPTQCSATKFCALVEGVTEVLHVRFGAPGAWARWYRTQLECGAPGFGPLNGERVNVTEVVAAATTVAAVKNADGVEPDESDTASEGATSRRTATVSEGSRDTSDGAPAHTHKSRSRAVKGDRDGPVRDGHKRRGGSKRTASAMDVGGGD